MKKDPTREALKAENEQLKRELRAGEGERTILDMRTVMSGAMKLLRPLIPANIDVREEIPEKCPPITGEAAQLQQLIINMGTNAIHAMQTGGGRLTISLDAVKMGSKGGKEAGDDGPADFPADLSAEDYVRLTIADTGCGISPEHLGRIFDPYFTTKEVGTGSGMGLAVVHGIVKGHGGGISVKSTPGRRTIFRVFLPASSEKPAVELTAADELPRGNEHVLFVDDESSIVEIGHYRLKSLGYEVTAFTDPVKAFRAFADAPDTFDLLITDMTMPQMTGDILAQQVREIRPDMKILLCTGYSDRMDEQKAAGLGIGYLMKPVSRKEFAEVVRRVLDGEM